MTIHRAGRRPGYRFSPILIALPIIGLSGLLSPALADGQAEPGQTALLTVSVSVDGSVVAPQGRKDEVVRWSTKRSYEASVKMVAQKPDKVSFSAMTGNDPNAIPQVYTDMAKQAEACGEDQACLMRMAMQMANSQEMKKAKDVPAAFQLWKAVEDAPAESKVSYEDKWYTLFYVSGPEITDCTLTAPKVSPELTAIDPNAQATWEKINQETMQSVAEAFVIETDTSSGTSQLQMPTIAAGSGDEKCTLTIGGNPETQHRSTNGVVIPVGEMKSLVLKGSSPGSGVISSGSEVVDTKLLLTQLGAGFAVEVTVPIKVKVDWTLKAQ